MLCNIRALIVFLLACCSVGYIYSDLEELCGSSHEISHGIVKLNSSLVYTISPNYNDAFCIINNSNITIISMKASSRAEVVCANDSIQSDPQPSRGIVFINSTVSIKRVEFVNCGQYLKNLPDSTIEIFNTSSSLYYPSTYAAALIFLNSEVHVNDVRMTSSFGFAVLGFNLLNSTFSYCWFDSTLSFNAGVNENRIVGSGFIIHYSDYQDLDLYGTIFTVIYVCKFFYNFMYMHTKADQCLTSDYSGNKPQLRPVLNSAALTVLYSQAFYQANVSINSSWFSRNAGTFANSLLIIHYETKETSITEITNSSFSIGNSMFTGACQETGEVILNFSPLVLHTSTVPLIVKNSSFVSHQSSNIDLDPVEKRALYIVVNIKGTSASSPNASTSFVLKNVLFHKINAGIGGVVIHMHNMSPSINAYLILESANVSDNKVTAVSSVVELSLGMFTLTGVTCIINGTKSYPSVFERNYGTVFKAIDQTHIFLYGYVKFIGNLATSGGAYNIMGNSRLYFMEGLVAFFEKNKASSLGGAIYADVKSLDHQCAFYFEKTNSSNTKIMFVNNSAVDGGSSIYASPLFNCYLNKNTKISSNIDAMKMYNKLLIFKGLSSIQLNISTMPAKFESATNIARVFAGQDFLICLAARDVFNRSVYAAVKIEISPDLYIKKSESHVWLSYRSKDQSVEEGQSCTNLTFSLHAVENSPTVKRLVLYFTENFKVYYSIQVFMQSCPLGFSLDPQTGSCSCSSTLKRIYKSLSQTMRCDIQTQVFARTGEQNAWAGKTLNNEFAIALKCPIRHCRGDTNLKWFHSTGSTVSLKELPKQDKAFTVCTKGRNGLLCGKCTEGLSHVFGSIDCKHCPSYFNYWLIIILTLAVGPFLVFILYALRLTLDVGTINGIVLYSGILYINLFDLMQRTSDYQTEWRVERFLISFISMINLDLGFPVCFFKDMTELWKTALSMIFPFYLLTIVFAIVVLSRRSPWLSNKTSHSSVQVLVTVVHYSFTKLLVGIIRVFSSTKLHIKDRAFRVWLYDGSVMFFEDSNHVILTIVSSLTVFPLISLYVVFLLCRKVLQRHSARMNLFLRPIYEAIHAPYKVGKEYWFVKRLLILISICSLNFFSNTISSFSIHLISALILCLFLIGQTLSHPYKYKTLEFLDSWSLLNLLVIYGGVLVWHDDLRKSTLILVVSSMLMFLTNIGIVFYHFLFVTGLLKRLRQMLLNVENRLLFSTYFRSLYKPEHQRLLRSTDSFYSSCDHCREPVIED